GRHPRSVHDRGQDTRRAQVLHPRPHVDQRRPRAHAGRLSRAHPRPVVAAESDSALPGFAAQRDLRRRHERALSGACGRRAQTIAARAQQERGQGSVRRRRGDGERHARESIHGRACGRPDRHRIRQPVARHRAHRRHRIQRESRGSENALSRAARRPRAGRRRVTRPRLAVTLGDPRGIGPEIVERAARDDTLHAVAELVLVGPRGPSLTVDESVGDWMAGSGEAVAGALAGRAIERAVELARSGAVQGIVTAPIDKHALLAGGFDFPGHTEMLAHLTGSRVAMMLASDRLRVVLATTHIPLRDVTRALTHDAIVETADVTRRGLQDWYGLEQPRIALCALNPHAGDHGRFGSDDDELLAPAARSSGLLGPFPADTVFVRAIRGEFDAVIAPYHDVGMTAIKVASFGSAVNVTLGLPFPRTSPDHGTALDIAGRGVADPSSFIVATGLCAEIVRRRRRALLQ